jgi:glycosyltransferase involved in cell wall biosynthesis
MKDDLVRVLAWVPHEVGRTPGQRFRIEQWTPHLRAHGIEIAFSPFLEGDGASVFANPGHASRKARWVLSSLARRCAEAIRRTRADLVYIFREGALIGPALAERMLHLQGRPFVFDFDDAVWVRYVSPANGLLSHLRFPAKTQTLCRKARHVLAGNAFLRDYALRFNPRVSVIPTTIDTDLYRPRSRGESALPVIGWSGSFSTVQYLDLVRGALERLARRRRFRVVVVGGTGFSASGVEVECRPWRADTEIDEISGFDVGIMPLPDDEWARGKCGLKALQYMALEVPPVVSPVGVNAEIVEDGTNGLWARSEDDWVEQLDRLLTDLALRRRLGVAARQRVDLAYSAAAVTPRVAAILKTAAAA